MPVFAYRAFTADGRPARGLVDADTSRGAWQTLRARGVYPTAITDAARTGAGPRLPSADLADATRRLASLLAAGLPLAEALEAAAELCPPAMARALALATGRVREGSPVADAVAAIPGMPAVCPALVRAGEASGDLAGALARLADHLEAGVARRRRLQAALAYPAVVAVTTLAVLLFLLAWVLPQMEAAVTAGGGQLPPLTRAVLGAGRVLRATWWLWTAAVVAAIAAAWRLRRRGLSASAWDRLGAAPLVGAMLREAAAARAADALGTLLRAGVALDAAMPLAADAAGPALARALLATGERVREGDALAHAMLRTAAFPPLLVRLVATGERTGTLAASLAQAGALLDAGVSRRIDRATALVEPALVLAAGGGVLAVVLVVLLPILGLEPTGAR